MPLETVVMTARPVRSAVACLGTRKSDLVSTWPSSAPRSLAAVR